MDPPNITFKDDKSIMIVSSSNKIKQIFCPFRVKCIREIDSIRTSSLVYVSQVREHKQYRIIFEIHGKWYPYSSFIIS